MEKLHGEFYKVVFRIFPADTQADDPYLTASKKPPEGWFFV